MNKEELFKLADMHFKIRQKNNHFIDKPEFYKFPLPVPDRKFNATVVIKRGEIKEVEIIYEDGSAQTIRNEPE